MLDVQRKTTKVESPLAPIRSLACEPLEYTSYDNRATGHVLSWPLSGPRGAPAAPVRAAARAAPPTAGPRRSRTWAASRAGTLSRRVPQRRCHRAGGAGRPENRATGGGDGGAHALVVTVNSMYVWANDVCAIVYQHVGSWWQPPACSQRSDKIVQIYRYSIAVRLYQSPPAPNYQ